MNQPRFYILPVAIGETGFVKLNEADHKLATALYYWLLASPMVTGKMEVKFVENDVDHLLCQSDDNPKSITIKLLGDYSDLGSKDADEVTKYGTNLQTELDKIGKGVNDKLLILNPHLHPDTFGVNDLDEDIHLLNRYNLSEVGEAIEPWPDED